MVWSRGCGLSIGGATDNTSGPEQPAVLHPAVLDKVPYKVQNSVIRYHNCGIDVQTGADNYRTWRGQIGNYGLDNYRQKWSCGMQRLCEGYFSVLLNAAKPVLFKKLSTNRPPTMYFLLNKLSTMCLSLLLTCVLVFVDQTPDVFRVSITL